MRPFGRILIAGAALWVAVHVVPGITYVGHPIWLLLVAIVFGVINSLIKPVLIFLSLPILLLSLGLFAFVVNAVVLWMTSAVAGSIGLGFHVAGFGAAFWGALIVSLVTAFFSMLLGSDRDREVSEA